jgi:hypothetical protein
MMTLENGENSGRTNATMTNDTNAEDGMKTYNAKAGFIELIFMTGKAKDLTWQERSNSS